MERETSPAAAADRERRERLERLQVELREVKAQLPQVASQARAAVVAVEVAIAGAKEQLRAEQRRAWDLEKQRAQAEADVASLRDAYNEVVARQLAAHARKGFLASSDNHGPDLGVLLVIVPLVGVAGLLIALMVQGCLK